MFVFLIFIEFINNENFLIYGISFLLTPAPPTLTVPLPPAPFPVTDYGMPITLVCEAAGLDIQWVWHYNGAELDFTGPTLSIESAVEEDTGIYQCTAYNPAGFNSSTTFVSVQSELLEWETEDSHVMVFTFAVYYCMLSSEAVLSAHCDWFTNT